MSDPVLRAAPLRELEPETLYAILRLRVDVFVVEQGCSFAELDGRDTEPTAIHLWHEQAGAVLSTARLLTDTGATGEAVGRIGRVATAPHARGQGLAGALIEHGLAHFAGRAVVLGAQSHLEAYYGRFGFAVSGPGYDEDGIPHLPMRRPPVASPR